MAPEKRSGVEYRELLLTYLTVVLLGGVSCTGTRQKTLYTLHTMPASWNTAKNVCWRNGGRLAVVDHVTVSSVLQGFPDTDWNGINVSSSYWIGLFRKSGQAHPSTWSGDCQQETDNQNWETGESDSSGLCTSASFTTGKWSSTSCSTKLKFVCESVEGPCTFREHGNVYLLDSPSFTARVESFSSTYTECTERFCNSARVGSSGDECWGVVHNNTKANCVTYLSVSNETVTNSNQSFPKDNTDLYLRHCDAGNCTFERYPSSSLKDSDQYQKKTLPRNGTERECKEYCLRAVKDGMSCWAVVVVSRACRAYFTNDPEDLKNSSHRRFHRSTKLHLRTCHEDSGSCQFTLHADRTLQIPADITYKTQKIALQLTREECLDYCSSIGAHCSAAELSNINGQCIKYVSSNPGELENQSLWVQQSDSSLHLRICYEGQINTDDIPNSMVENSSQPKQPCYPSNDTIEEVTMSPYTDTEVMEPSTVLVRNPSPIFTDTDALEASTAFVTNPQPTFADIDGLEPSTAFGTNPQPTFTDTLEASTTFGTNPQPTFTDTLEASNTFVTNPQPTFTDTDALEASTVLVTNPPPNFTDTLEASNTFVTNPQPTFTDINALDDSAALATNLPLTITDVLEPTTPKVASPPPIFTYTEVRETSNLLLHPTLTFPNTEAVEPSKVSAMITAQKELTPTSTQSILLEASDHVWQSTDVTDTSVALLASESPSACLCPCSTGKILSPVESSAFMSSILDHLSLPKVNISRYRRKRESVMEYEPVATGLGYMGAAILGVVFGGLVLLDLPRLLRDMVLLARALLRRDS